MAMPLGLEEAAKEIWGEGASYTIEFGTDAVDARDNLPLLRSNGAFELP